jgi:N-acetylmuramoyl-L-alanine amidase
MVKDPERLVVDLEGIELNNVLESLGNKVAANDPNIKLLRAGRYKPGVVRLVMELKGEVNPQVFVLPPVGGYGHRLVLDVYPLNPPDPLLSLLDNKEPRPQRSKVGHQQTGYPSGAVCRSQGGNEIGVETEKSELKPELKSEPQPVAEQKAASRRQGRPVVDRLVTITLDPGHGGEDPGAVGSGGSLEKNVTLAVAKRLRAKIESEPNMRAVLTRDSDFFVPLHARVQKARRIQSDLFVSIHADALSARMPTARRSSFSRRVALRVPPHAIWRRRKTLPI